MFFDSLVTSSKPYEVKAKGEDSIVKSIMQTA